MPLLALVHVVGRRQERAVADLQAALLERLALAALLEGFEVLEVAAGEAPGA